MAGVANLLECWVAAESSLAENAESPSSNSSWDWRIPIEDYVVNVNQDRILDGGLRSRTNEESLTHRGVRSCSIEIEGKLPGYMATTAGALSQTWIQDLFSDALGGGSVAANGTTLSGATSGSSMTFTSTSGMAVGMIYRVGAKGDGRGDGQPIVISAIGPPTTSLCALPATPQSGGVVYAMEQAYPDESTLHTLGTKRFMVGFSSSPTAGEQYQLMGCQMAALKLRFPLGEIPRYRATYQGAYWQRSATTIPSTSLALQNQFAAPVAAGRLFINDVGTATAATLVPSVVELDINMGLEPIIGTGGNGTYQHIVGWVRSKCQPLLTLTIPWTSAYETWWDTANESLTAKHILFSTNAVDGRSVSLYLPNVIPKGPRPSFPTISNNQTYVTVQFQGRDGTTTTSELTRSAWRLARG